MWAAFLGIAGLAFLDSLNPFSIAAMALVIMGRNSLSRGLIFIGATFATYYIGGVALLAGWTLALKSLLPLIAPLIAPWAATAGWSIVAVACLAGAVWLWRKRPAASQPDETRFSGKALFGVMAFAIVSTASDLPTAIPYFGAIPMIAATQAGLEGAGPNAASLLMQGAWLLLYNVIYVSPLILLLWFRVFASARFEPLQAKISAFMDWTIRCFTPPLLVLVGIWAVIEGWG